MGDSLELIGKRLLLLLDDGRSANGSEPDQAAWARDWLRGTVRAVSVIGLAGPEVSVGEATTTTTAAGLTVSVYIQLMPACIAKYTQFNIHAICASCLLCVKAFLPSTGAVFFAI